MIENGQSEFGASICKNFQWFEGLLGVASKAYGLLWITAVIFPKSIVVATEPPTPEAFSHIASIKVFAKNQRISHAQAHGCIVCPLAPLAGEFVELAVEFQLRQVKMWRSNFISDRDVFERMSKSIAWPNCTWIWEISIKPFNKECKRNSKLKILRATGHLQQRHLQPFRTWHPSLCRGSPP